VSETIISLVACQRELFCIHQYVKSCIRQIYLRKGDGVQFFNFEQDYPVAYQM